MAEREPNKELVDLILQGRRLAGQVLSDALGYGFIDGYGLVRTRGKQEEDTFVRDGIEYTTAPLEPGETPIRIMGHSGVSGQVGEVGTIGEQGVYRWFETPEGVKRFRVKG